MNATTQDVAIRHFMLNINTTDVNQDIIKWSIDGAGVRAISREFGISIDTVISEFKKKKVH